MDFQSVQRFSDHLRKRALAQLSLLRRWSFSKPWRKTKIYLLSTMIWWFWTKSWSKPIWNCEWYQELALSRRFSCSWCWIFKILKISNCKHWATAAGQQRWGLCWCCDVLWIPYHQTVKESGASEERCPVLQGDAKETGWCRINVIGISFDYPWRKISSRECWTEFVY